MRAIINRYGFDGIWHFTDRSNLQLIQQHGGLLSYTQILHRGIDVPVLGGNDWSHDADRIKGVDQFVHMTFLDDHPMLYRARQDGRINDPVWLKIKADVIEDPAARFTSDVANKAGVPVLTAEEAMEEIDFEVLFTYMDWRYPAVQVRRQAALKSEILFPEFVPINKILGIKNG